MTQYASGIYVIRNMTNEHQYVGSSGNIVERFRKHCEALRRGKHHSVALQRAWNKHGEAAFNLLILELHYNQETLKETEQRWLDSTHVEYNCSKSATGPVLYGSKLPEVWKENIRLAVEKLRASGVKMHPAGPLNLSDEERALRRTRVLGTKRALGYRCTEDQKKNRSLSAKIGNMKRWYKDSWKEEFLKRYGDHDCLR